MFVYLECTHLVVVDCDLDRFRRLSVFERDSFLSAIEVLSADSRHVVSLVLERHFSVATVATLDRDESLSCALLHYQARLGELKHSRI